MSKDKTPDEPNAPEETKDPKKTKSTTKKVTRVLLCKLGDKELAQAGRDLDSNLSKIEEKDVERKAAEKLIKADIELLEGVTTKLRGILKSGGEEKEVECEETYDYTSGEVRVKRLDTGEVFTKRNMSSSEYQLPLAAQKPAGKLIPMDGGKGKEETCGECQGTGKVQISRPGDTPLTAKCENCDGKGTIAAKDPLTAKLGDVAAQHAQNKAEADAAAAAEGPAKEGDGHPEVEKILAKRQKGKGKKAGKDEPPIDPETGKPLDTDF